MSFISDAFKHKQWRKIVLMSIAVALLAVAALNIFDSFRQTEKARPVAATQIQLKNTEVLTVNPSALAQTLPLSGALNPYTQATVSARASGEIAQVLVREGESVQKGQVLATLVDTTYRAQLEQALANEVSAASSLRLAEQDLSNNQKLVAEGFISPIALQKIQVARDSAQAQVQNARQAKVIAQRALSEVNIKAPVSGVISVRNVRAGESAAIGTAMFVIVNIDALELQAPISAEQIGAIQVGQTVQLSSAGLAAPFSGMVERINPAATNGSRSYVAYIRVENSAGLLKAGMFAQGQITIAGLDGVLSVPATALRTRADTQFVYGIQDGKIVEHVVTTGVRASDAIAAPVEIKTGLKGGDTIVGLDLGQLKVGTNVVLLNADGQMPAVDTKTAPTQSVWQKLLGLFKSS